MPGSEPDDENAAAASPSANRPHRKALTPEQRRLLGTPRSWKAEAARHVEVDDSESTPASQVDEPAETITETSGHGPVSKPEHEVPRSSENRLRSAEVSAQTKVSRAIELRHAVLVIGVLVFLSVIFYAGRKFDYVKYAVLSRIKAQELEGGPDKFPGVTSDELIETALAAEKKGDWKEATERFIAAKRKNRAMPGILFRVGKGSYDRGDLEGADLALSHAIRFGENLPVANYYRGLIAVRRHDLPAAIRFFETAAAAEPFLADLYYFWGEALRLDFKPRDAIRRYEQAIQRTASASDATLCSFKIRLARIEAAEASKVAAEVEEKRKAGPLSVDWLMTDAALQLQSAKIAEAAQLIAQARDLGLTGLYLTCAGDTLFVRTAQAHPEIGALIMPTASAAQQSSRPFEP